MQDIIDLNSRLAKAGSRILPILLLGIVALISWRSIGKSEPREVNFTTSIATDASPALVQLMLAIENGEPVSKITFEKGTYHFYPDKALERYVYISNHNDQLTRTPFLLTNQNDLVIDGKGSKFIFHGRMIPFQIEGGENIEIKNLTIDWAMPFHSEAKIVAHDEAAHTFDMEISDDYPYEIRNGQLIFVKEYYEHGVGQSILFDPERNAIAFNTESFTPLTQWSRTAISRNVEHIQYPYTVDKIEPPHRFIGNEKRLKVEEVALGRVRVFNHAKKLPPVGTILVCKGNQWENRLSPAFHVVKCTNFKATNVTVHHAGGMGIIVENSKDITLRNFNVKPSHGRMVSTTADATHFVGCRGQVLIEDCTFQNQLDDACNVHGVYQPVIDILDEHRIGVRMGHFQQQGFEIGFPGDTIGFVRLSESFDPYAQVILQSIEKINGRYHILTFQDPVPTNLEPSDLVENLSAYPSLIVRNCDISRNRARGLLLSTPKPVLIEKNYFHTEMEALLFPVESSFWYESGSVRKVVVRDNVFQDCNHSGYNRGIIRFVTDDDNHHIAFRNILIENNRINQFDNAIMEVSNTDHLIFRNNTITQTTTFPRLYPENPAFSVKASKNIEFSGNIYSGMANPILVHDESVDIDFH